MSAARTIHKTAAVAGATGAQGGATARHLLARGHAVRGIVRDPAGAAAARLRSLGIETAPGDFDDPSSLAAAMTGVDATFLMATPYIDGGIDAEIRHATALIDTAVAAGVPHIVYSSVASADRHTGVPHFDSKALVERHLHRVAPGSTVVAPTEFIDLLVSPWVLDALRAGEIGVPVPGDVPRQLTAVDDIGAFVARVIEAPAAFAGRRVEIASLVATGDQLAAAIERAAGRPIRYVERPMAAAGSDDLAAMYRFFRTTGFAVDIAGLHADHPDVAWRDADTWAAGIDWPALLATPAAA